MSSCAVKQRDAVKGYVFDLDGVITDTASLHCAAWAHTFDRFCRSRRTDLMSPSALQYQFDSNRDYAAFLDGKSRLSGIESLLNARGIRLPMGKETDQGLNTIHGLGNAKNKHFLKLIETQGIAKFQDAVALIHSLSEQHYLLALASSSKNAKRVLKQVALAQYFHCILDGNDVLNLGFNAKPAPDIYQESFRRLALHAKECVIIEDAVAGVEAARAANPQCVVGINRLAPSNSKTLKIHGADIVLNSLTELIIEAPHYATSGAAV